MANKISLRELHTRVQENKPVAQYFYYDKSDVNVDSSAERIKPDLTKLSFTNDEIYDISPSSILDDLNKSIREHRRKIFYHKVMTNKKAKKIVTEGNSWHLYPLLIDEMVDQLNDDKDLAIYSVDGAGDTVYNMALRQFNDPLEGALGGSKLV